MAGCPAPKPPVRGDGCVRMVRALLFAACALAGCSGDGASPPGAPASADGGEGPERAPKARDGFWLGDDGARARALLAALARAGDDGLDPEQYGTLALARALEGGMDAAMLEPALDAAFLRYAADLRHGRVRPQGAEPPRYVPRPRQEPEALRELIADWEPGDDLAVRLRPPGTAYAGVQAAFVRYRDIAADGGWPAPPAPPTLHPADPGAPPTQLATLHARLGVEDTHLRDVPADSAAARATLVEALRAFQQRHGLAADGVLGVATRTALAVPTQARATQLALALERLRWPDAQPHPDGIEVNVPDATLVLYREGRAVLHSRVVVGRPSWATPIFATRATGVLFHPAWSVPANIARKELLPMVRRDPGYLARESMEVLSGANGSVRVLDPAEVDWSAPGPIHLRQRPGPRNALGRLKLQMPNRYAVFLHDTPQRELFGRDLRALSHGCVRVERARELAAALLPGGAARVDELLAGALTREVGFGRPVPVQIVYRTAWVEAGSAIHFRADVYGYDAQLARALRLPPSAPPANNVRSSTRPRGDHG